MSRYTARKATLDDIPALKSVTGRDESRRLATDGRSYHPDNSMIVVEAGGRIVGSVFLVFTRPSAWADAGDTSCLPQMISFVVRTENRNQGAGTFLEQAVEAEVRARGGNRLYLGVDPDHNPGALRLYERLGFRPLSQEKRRSAFTYTDENGVTREHVEWLIDMVKVLEA